MISSNPGKYSPLLALLLLALSLLRAEPASAGGRTAPGTPDADRGRQALTARGYLRPEWGMDVYRAVAGLWGDRAPDPEADPGTYADAFADRYGLHPAPYPNDGLPMGLRRATDPKSGRVGFQVDCLACHGGSIGGTSYVGLGNTRLDMIGLYRDFYRADGRPLYFTGFTVNTARGTVNAGQMAAILIALRSPDLSPRLFPVLHGAKFAETDVPAWWTLKHKGTMYYDGRTDARSVRSIMQFMLGEKSREQFEELEPTFGDILAYLKSIEAPEYPFPVDPDLAERGRGVFEVNCARCHGTYGEGRTYPNRVVELEVIGTDPARALAPTDSLVSHYNKTWFAEHHPVDEVMTGYQAPPLDGVWATAPYLHNGSVPTLSHLLDSDTRPGRFRRPPSTDFEHYDTGRVGWRVEVLDPVEPEIARRDRDRSIFDASRFGLGNRGHTFGDPLTDDERRAVIEYLKTL
ncbi:c-type cytochrome [Tautonia plasticadhaerens]|uniref:Cytochrome c n=1 Tax=Tautonia plasticadhaerens TaxID=2527974 RepID=A0A518GVP1_9BACT|nr:c-type cytochrome [Tautonia plasticadhaerens]QDV32621.1 Cytochrome c [Tautonia plasticadhaerens]